MTFKPLSTLAIAVAALGALALPAHAGKTLDGIKARGQVICGVHTGLAGFSAADSNGKWSGIDVDVCRAVAAATLGDGEKVKYVPLVAQARFTALQSGEVDMLSRNTTFTLTRDASLGLSQTAVVYYDGQGFMVPVKSKIKSAKQLKGQTVCVQSGTTTEKNLTDYSKANGLNVKPVVFEKLDAVEGAYFSGRCIAYTTDASGLASVRNKSAKNPADHMILPELISKEPLGPMVRRGDDEWTAIVKWTVYGLLEAEEYGVTAANVDDLPPSMLYLRPLLMNQLAVLKSKCKKRCGWHQGVIEAASAAMFLTSRALYAQLKLMSHSDRLLKASTFWALRSKNM